MIKARLSSKERNPEALARIGARLRLAREQLGLSQCELAARTGGRGPRIASYERGNARLTARCLFQFARVLGRPVAWFFEGLPEAVLGTSGGTAAAPARPGMTAETQALIGAFEEIADPETRRDIIRLLRGIAAERRPREED